EYGLMRDEEASRQVMQEKMEEEERRRLVALKEAHVQHNANLLSVSHGSESIQATVEFQSDPRPLDTTPTIMKAETEESHAPPLNLSKKRHPITQRNKYERISKRMKLTFQGHGFEGSHSKPFSI
ncbi:hypothetical protein Tco_1288230, partial [Tanacetum coccineum]